MSRLKHRRRCRRGSTRRQIRHSPTSSSTSAATCSNSDSLSRAQRGHLHRSGRSFRSPNPPIPPAHPHTVHFSFNSSLNHPRVTASITVVFQETPQEMTPGSGRAAGSNEGAHTSGQSVGMKLTDSMDLQNVEVKDTRDDASNGKAGQPSSRPNVMKKDNGHAHAELPHPPPPGKVVTSIDELLNVDRDAAHDCEKPKTGSQASMMKITGDHLSEAQIDEGQASVVKVPSTSGKVIHSIADLHKDEGESDELWCRVVEAVPDE